jgi:hypothetical protein
MIHLNRLWVEFFPAARASAMSQTDWLIESKEQGTMQTYYDPIGSLSQNKSLISHDPRLM